MMDDRTCDSHHFFKAFLSVLIRLCVCERERGEESFTASGLRRLRGRFYGSSFCTSSILVHVYVE